MITTVTSILIVLSLFLGGSGAAVYASQDSQPGDILYSVKIASEDLQFRFERHPEGRVELALKFAGRRVSEAESLAENGKPIPISLVERLEENLVSALIAAAQAEDTELALEQIKEGMMILKRPTDRVQGHNKLPDNATLGMIQKMLGAPEKITVAGLENPADFKRLFGQVKEEILLGTESRDLAVPIDNHNTDIPADTEMIDDVISKSPTRDNQGNGPVGEDGMDGMEYQALQGEVYGPGDPQEQEAPNGPNYDTSGFGAREQYGNPNSNKPGSGAGDSSENGQGGKP